MIIYYIYNKYFKRIISSEKEYKNYKYWVIEYRNESNQLHRLDGPAREHSSGEKYWYKNGLRHREDGPAIDYDNRYKQYWYNGQQIPVNSDKEFKKYIKMIIFI
jgi:hypothetical protein